MKRLAVLIAVLATVAAACGGDDDNSGTDPGTRSIEIAMEDIRFEPDEIEVAAGETVRFVFENNGKVAHDAFIGDEGAQADHEDEMTSDDEGMEHGGGDEDAITVDPGDTGELTYTFGEPGVLLIGCHQPGHYDAGMIIEVTVT
jgi:uncharacterized cupredoxin-like copper-binding protein